MDITKLPKAARSAAMRGGTDAWGSFGSSAEHVRYAQPADPKSRRRCHCGCKRRATHMGMANGVALTTACELAVRRWVKTGHTKAPPNAALSRRGT
jgi:hypothetical protein